MKLKNIILAGSAAVLLNSIYPAIGYGKELNYTPASYQKIEENSKNYIDQARGYDAQGLYGNALLSYLKAKKLGAEDFIVNAKISGLKDKLKNIEVSYGVSVAPFNNFSNDPEIAGLIASNLTTNLLNKYKLSIRLAKSPDEAFNNKDPLIITGDIHSFDLGESKEVNSKTVKYKSGSERIVRKEYEETADDLANKCLSYERAKEESDRRKNSAGTDLVIGGIKALTGIGDWKDNVIRGGGAIAADSIFSSEDEYRRECSKLKERRSGMEKYEESPVYSFFTYDETIVKRQGKLRISLRLVESGTNRVLYNQTLEDYIKDKDKTRPEFLEAGVYGDPLKIASAFELREKLINNIIGKVSEILKDSLEGYKPISLMKKATEATDKKQTIEFYMRGLIQGKNLDKSYLNEVINYINKTENLNLRLEDFSL